MDFAWFMKDFLTIHNIKGQQGGGLGQIQPVVKGDIYVHIIM